MNENDLTTLRKCRNMSEFYASAVADQGKTLVPEDVCEAFVSGWESALSHERARSEKLVKALIKIDNSNDDMKYFNSYIHKIIKEALEEYRGSK